MPTFDLEASEVLEKTTTVKCSPFPLFCKARHGLSARNSRRSKRIQVMQESNKSPTDSVQHWYVAYTMPKHEKAIAERLRSDEISCYVPLYSETRTWRQRKVQIDLPLFPCYVFVKMALKTKARLLSAPGVVRLLSASGSAIIFPDEDMDFLQSSLKNWSARPYPFHSSGKRVRLKSGPFAGLQGTIIRRDGMRKLVITLDIINSSMLLDVDISDAQLSI
jgi:transcription antitermination factor NusG